MVGSHNVSITNKVVHYEMCIDRKVTIIKGDSGTGKSTMIDLLRLWLERGIESGVRVKSDLKIDVLFSEDSAERGINRSGHILFMDEGYDFIHERWFTEGIKSSDNYFVIITRTGGFRGLPYSVESIYEIKSEKIGRVTLNKFVRFHRD